MKLNSTEDVLYGNNPNKPTQFKIQTSSKAFKILSNNLYKNKIRAIIRELSCNALDAHQLNNCTDPFDILVPTEIDPRFQIRDYGPGLNDEDMNELYTTYFASTKNESNEFRGALGLGSKTPFSYTSAFTVVSYHGGYKTKFNALLEHGEPALYQVSKTPSTERSGLEITIPVRSDDLRTWFREVGYVLRPFINNKPNIRGVDININYIPDEDVLCGSSTQSAYPVYKYDSRGIYANYGNIIYPIDDSNDELLDVDNKYPWISNVGGTYIIKFDMGELDIQPSREELSFDDITLANIHKKLKSIDDQLKETFVSTVSDLTCPRVLDRYLYDMSTDLSKMVTKEAKLPTRVPLITDADREELSILGYKKIIKEVTVSNSLSLKRKRLSDIYSNSTISFESVISSANERYIIVQFDKVVSIDHVYKSIVEEYSMVRGEHIFIVDKQHDIEPIKALFKRFAHSDEVIVLNSSKYWVKRNITRDRTQATRPKTDNVYIYKYDRESDTITSSYCKMSAKEIMDIDYEFSVLSLNREELHDPCKRTQTGIDKYDLKRFMSITNQSTLLCVRNTHVDYALNHEKSTSFIDVLETFVNAVDLSTVDRIYHINQYYHDGAKKERRLIDFLTNTGLDNKTLEDIKGAQVLIDVQYIITNTILFLSKRPVVRDLNHKWIEYLKAYYVKFEEANPLIGLIVRNCTQVSPEVLEQIKPLYKQVGE